MCFFRVHGRGEGEQGGVFGHQRQTGPLASNDTLGKTNAREYCMDGLATKTENPEVK